MSILRNTDKQEAANERTFFRRFRNAAATSTAAIALVDPTAVSYLLITGILAALAEDRSLVAGQIAEDPPRFDFEVATRVQPKQLYPQALGSSDIDRQAAAVLESFVRSIEFYEAWLRAVERAMGAQGAQRPELRDARLSEATQMINQAAEADFAFSQAADGLARSLHEVDERRGLVAPPTLAFPPQASMEELLPPDALALMYRFGLPIRYARRRFPLGASPLRPLASVSQQLSEAAIETNRAGEHFMSWSPALAE